VSDTKIILFFEPGVGGICRYKIDFPRPVPHPRLTAPHRIRIRGTNRTASPHPRMPHPRPAAANRTRQS